MAIEAFQSPTTISIFDNVKMLYLVQRPWRHYFQLITWFPHGQDFVISMNFFGLIRALLISQNGPLENPQQ